MSPRFKNFVIQWANNAIGVVVASYLVRGIHWQKPLDLAVAAFLLGILNTFVRRALVILSLPLMILTFGLFYFVINGLLLYLVGRMMYPEFEVASFWAAFWGALVITVVAFILNLMTGTGNAKVNVHRGPPPPRNPRNGGGNGPVIDI